MIISANPLGGDLLSSLFLPVLPVRPRTGNFPGFSDESPVGCLNWKQMSVAPPLDLSVGAPDFSSEARNVLRGYDIACLVSPEAPITGHRVPVDGGGIARHAMSAVGRNWRCFSLEAPITSHRTWLPNSTVKPEQHVNVERKDND